MNIVYHHRTMGRGAEGLHISHIVKAFKNAGHNVYIISPPGVSVMDIAGECPVDKGDVEVKGISSIWKFISKKTPQFCFELFEVFYNFYAIIKLYLILKNKQVDMIYERNAFFLFAGAFIAKAYNVPLVVEANEVVGIKRARKLIFKPLAKIIERYTFNYAVSIYTVSSFLKNLIHKTVGESVQVVVTPNAVEPEEYCKPLKGDLIKSRYGLKGQIVLGFVGWFDWWDRLDLLLLLQQKLEENGIGNVSTMIVGDGLNKDELVHSSIESGLEGKVVFTGAVKRDEVLDYIDAFDIGIFPHSNEFGSPVALFEMMALGKCIVAPELQPITDVLTHKENALIFPPLDTDELFHQICELSKNKNLISRLGIAAKQKVFKNYTWRGNAEKIINSIG